MDFRRNDPHSSWKNLIFEISTKKWIDRYVFEIIAWKFFFDEIFARARPHPSIKKSISSNQFYFGLFLSPFAIKKHFIFLELVYHCPSSFFMKFIFFRKIPEGDYEQKFYEKKIYKQWFRIHTDRLSFLCWFQIRDFFKANGDHSVENPSNINQKSPIENKLLRVWLSG